MSDGGPWRGPSPGEWKERFMVEADVPLCSRCSHPWPLHVPDDRDGWACRACRCRRMYPPPRRNATSSG